MSPPKEYVTASFRPAADAREETYDLALLDRSFAKWRRSPALRAVYGDIYREMLASAPPGPALEIGSGIGTMRDVAPGIVTSDIRKTPFVDHAASAYAIEAVPGGPWAAIHLLDVLHHLREPFRFFASAAQSLVPGGRIVLCDPAATPVGRAVYRATHHEPVSPGQIQAPYQMPADSPSGEFANMGMAWALFVRDRGVADEMLASIGLRVATIRFRDVLAYLSTGGFSRPALLPEGVLRLLLRLERALPEWLLQAIALRMIVVLERVAAAPRAPEMGEPAMRS